MAFTDAVEPIAVTLNELTLADLVVEIDKDHL